MVGTGYVGLVTGACFAQMGVSVVCVDVDKEKIASLQEGRIPIYEPGLEEMVKRNSDAGRLSFTCDLADALSGAEVVFSAVGTPPDQDGSVDLHYVEEVAGEVGRSLQDPLIFVTKSTVPVGTAARVRSIIQAELDRRGVKVDFEVASNPEFLKEGAAVEDFMRPERVVVGVESEKARQALTRLYRPFMLNGDRLIFTDIASAEMIKYAANAMLATRISFMNDIASLCEKVGADIDMVRKGIGSDSRIGSKFLYAGCGYGGSCFPKDVKALISTGEKNGVEMQILKAVEAVNERQKGVLFDKLARHYLGMLKGKTVTLWGLAFKPETDDMREAPALVLIEKLTAAGCKVKVYDPVAMSECRRRVGDRVIYCEDMYSAARGSEALLLVTEWKEFRMPNWARVKADMASALVIDGRNIYNRAELLQKGFAYYRIG